MSFLVTDYHTYVQWEVQVLLLFSGTLQVESTRVRVREGKHYVMFIIGKDLFLAMF